MSSGRAKSAKRDERYGGVRNFYGDPEKIKAKEAELAKKEKRGPLPLTDRECLKCGTPLHFARTMEGKTIPLDLKAHIYCIVYERSEATKPCTVVRTELCYVSHFFTCPYADDFSGKAKAKGEAHGDSRDA